MQLNCISKNKIINLINWLIDFFILLTIGLVPIYFAFLYKDYSIFGLDKVVLFRSLTEVLLLLYITKIVLEGKIVSLMRNALSVSQKFSIGL